LLTILKTVGIMVHRLPLTLGRLPTYNRLASTKNFYLQIFGQPDTQRRSNLSPCDSFKRL
jgi:hypothetical protein